MHTGSTAAPVAQTAPERRGDVAEARIESLDYEAQGVAHIDGKVTFIAGGLPGERVRFRYHNKRRHYDTGAVIEVLEPSPERVAPPCPAFGRCGGCSLQHMTPGGQIAAKGQMLAQTLAHIGRVVPERWLEPLSGPDRGYRRRARLGVRFVPKKGGVLVGFRERRRSYITPLDACLTLDPRVSALLPDLHGLIADLSRPDRIPQIEAAAGDDRLALVFRHLEPLTEADRERLVAFARMHEITVYAQPGAAETAAPLWPRPAPPLAYTLPAFDVRLEFAPTGFVQVNAEINRAVVLRAMDLLELGPGDSVLDLFCGLGNFTLPAARRAGRVLGIEADVALIDRARANARANGLDNIEFRAADLYAELPSLPWQGEHFDKLLLDPPRTGAIEVIKALGADTPRRIVYVSCYPGTLARDAEYLVRALGYRFEAAGVADMFPHTAHVESLALFVK